MKKTFLYMTVNIPITYDDSRITEKQAQDTAEKIAREALTRSLDGRHFDTDGRYQDATGPKLIAAQPEWNKP